MCSHCGPAAGSGGGARGDGILTGRAASPASLPEQPARLPHLCGCPHRALGRCSRLRSLLLPGCPQTGAHPTQLLAHIHLDCFQEASEIRWLPRFDCSKAILKQTPLWIWAIAAVQDMAADPETPARRCWIHFRLLVAHACQEPGSAQPTLHTARSCADCTGWGLHGPVC